MIKENSLFITVDYDYYGDGNITTKYFRGQDSAIAFVNKNKELGIECKYTVRGFDD